MCNKFNPFITSKKCCLESLDSTIFNKDILFVDIVFCWSLFYVQNIKIHIFTKRQWEWWKWSHLFYFNWMTKYPISQSQCEMTKKNTILRQNWSKLTWSQVKLEFSSNLIIFHQYNIDNLESFFFLKFNQSLLWSTQTWFKINWNQTAQ